MTGEQARYYLAAFIDGEGSVRSNGRRELAIGNTDPDLIAAVLECFAVLGITHGAITRSSRGMRGRRDMLYVNVYRKSNFEILATLPLRSAAKRDLIAHAAGRTCVARDRDENGRFVLGHPYFPKQAA